MIKHSMKLAACFGIASAAVLASGAMAMSQQACEQLPGDAFLSAVERGDCEINIQTAAGPQHDSAPTGGGGGGNRASRDGRNDGGNGGGERGGGGGGEGGDPGDGAGRGGDNRADVDR